MEHLRDTSDPEKNVYTFAYNAFKLRDDIMLDEIYTKFELNRANDIITVGVPAVATGAILPFSYIVHQHLHTVEVMPKIFRAGVFLLAGLGFGMFIKHQYKKIENLRFVYYHLGDLWQDADHLLSKPLISKGDHTSACNHLDTIKSRYDNLQEHMHPLYKNTRSYLCAQMILENHPSMNLGTNLYRRNIFSKYSYHTTLQWYDHMNEVYKKYAIDWVRDNVSRAGFPYVSHLPN